MGREKGGIYMKFKDLKTGDFFKTVNGILYIKAHHDHFKYCAVVADGEQAGEIHRMFPVTEVTKVTFIKIDRDN
jgi:hypothetical protein